MADRHAPESDRTKPSAASVPARAASAPEWGRRGLSRPLRRIAVAAAEGFLCDRNEAGELVAPDRAACEQVVDDFGLGVGAASAPMRLGMSALLVAAELLPIAVVGRARPMSRLPLAERVRYLESLESHRLGALVVLLAGLKIPMTLSAFEDGEGLRKTGFDRASLSATRRAAAASEPSSVAPSPSGDPPSDDGEADR
ncbi:MAG: hypothetical protein JRI23_09855 [Deltaproteobacteria bacterium]|jgi:hypothetical protein|nr:hypothetical protein [Deltaproteobacteria bacterium]MBW2531972.1 hypothetical protein [Deltaproteobacteria bacterium]